MKLVPLCIGVATPAKFARRIRESALPDKPAELGFFQLLTGTDFGGGSRAGIFHFWPVLIPDAGHRASIGNKENTVTVKNLIIAAYLALALSGCVTMGKESSPSTATGSDSGVYRAPVTRTLPEAAD